jgi:UDP-N-acetylmuramoyl-L-alanyl-D-glutamate--2,6-diaminopimelate ligase
MLDIPTGYIGSNGIMYKNYHHMSANTTPESCDIQRYLSDMVDAGIKYVIIEVSSQALYLGRVEYIEFDTCIFTNLSIDHIGEHEHPNFEHYRDCKAKLFTKFHPKRIIVNNDDDHTKYMICKCEAEAETYGIKTSAQHTACNIKLYKTNNTFGMSFDYLCGNSKYPLTINLPGEFNISNALAAITTCSGITGDIEAIIKAIQCVKVPGRFELVWLL